jgi:hypothetical protein
MSCQLWIKSDMPNALMPVHVTFEKLSHSTDQEFRLSIPKPLSPYSEKPATEPYHGPVQSNLHHSTRHSFISVSDFPLDLSNAIFI